MYRNVGNVMSLSTLRALFPLSRNQYARTEKALHLNGKFVELVQGQVKAHSAAVLNLRKQKLISIILLKSKDIYFIYSLIVTSYFLLLLYAH